MKAYLPEFQIHKLLLDSAMDAYPLYHYCKKNGITPFIDLKKTNNGNYKYKGTFTIDSDGVPRCKLENAIYNGFPKINYPFNHIIKMTSLF